MAQQESTSEEILLRQTTTPDTTDDYQDILYRIVLAEDEDEQNELGWKLLRHIYERSLEDKDIEVAMSIIYGKLRHLNGDEILKRKPLLLSLAFTFDGFLIDHLESLEKEGFDFTYYIELDAYDVAMELGKHANVIQTNNHDLPLEAYRSAKELSNLTRGELNTLVVKVQSYENAIEDIAPTLLPLFRLALFEYFLHNPIFDQEKFDRLVNKFRSLNELEKMDQSSSVPMGTVGLELESSQDGFSDNLVAFLVKFGMQVTRETDTLCEISFPFSFSTSVQSRYLQVLYEIGLFRTTSENLLLYDINGQEFVREYNTIDQANSTSIHFNYGLPSGIEDVDIVNDSSQALSKIAALLGFSYSSSHRLMNRKTNRGFFVNNDAILNSVTAQDSSDDEVGLRIEYRLSEFNDKTYRSLEAFQVFMYALMVYTRYKKGAVLDEKENRILDCFAAFLGEIDNTLSVNVDGENIVVDFNVIDNYQASVSGSKLDKVLNDKELDLQARCYKLAEDYSHRFRSIYYG